MQINGKLNTLLVQTRALSHPLFERVQVLKGHFTLPGWFPGVVRTINHQCASTPAKIRIICNTRLSASKGRRSLNK